MGQLRFSRILKKFVAAMNTSKVRGLAYRVLMEFFEGSTGEVTNGAFNIG